MQNAGNSCRRFLRHIFEIGLVGMRSALLVMTVARMILMLSSLLRFAGTLLAMVAAMLLSCLSGALATFVCALFIIGHSNLPCNASKMTIPN